MKYIWDNKKNEINIKKHGISFDLAKKVFLDENRIEWYDKEHSNDEDRYITIGIAGEVLFVVYTEQKENIRLISARLANKDEEERYYGYKKKKK